MSATRAKKVKMATKSCPECDQQVPVACKSCPCGYIFINRKLLKVKHSEKSSPFTEVDCTISLKDLRILFLYEFKLGHSAATASRNINSVFGEGSVSERTIRWWFEKFRSGDLSLKNEPRGRPKSVLNEDQLRAMVEANPKMAIRGLAADLGVSATTISRHLAAIGKVKKLDKWHHDPPYLCIRWPIPTPVTAEPRPSHAPTHSAGPGEGVGHCGPSRPSLLVRIWTRSKTGAVSVGARLAGPRSRRERPAAAAGACHRPPSPGTQAPCEFAHARAHPPNPWSGQQGPAWRRQGR
ncbi:uncharacterized protein LOC122234015 isoform X1 [Panthera tigris]|uniref:uncharacterized protein LOC122234015 isoform X1 n=1 Tax=Panthera tigris TaxID=9694 RepID=UPI001C6F6801|nr:uncharacterized protein LOC122234015 isoform X1 [Panthera tigris]